MPAGKKFCRACGNPLATPPKPEPAVVVTQEAPLLEPQIFSSNTTTARTANAAFSATEQQDDISGVSGVDISNLPAKGRLGRLVIPIAASIILVFLIAAFWYWRGAEIDLVTNPGGVTVVCDGKPFGTTSDQGGELVLKHLARGSHTLSLIHLGYGVWTQPVTLGWLELSHPLKVALPEPALPTSVRSASTVHSEHVPMGVPDDVGQFLQTWRNTFLTGDFDAHMECYAPVVETYYQKRNLTRADVRREREGMVAEYGSVRQFDVSNVELTITAQGLVDATFRTHWEISGKKYFAGEDTEKLILIQTGGRWLITREEEPTVYWVKKQALPSSAKSDIGHPCKDPNGHQPCPESAPAAASTNTTVKDVTSTVPTTGDPVKTVLDAFDDYIAGNTAGVTSLMSDDGARNAKLSCPGDAATCLRKNYGSFGNLQSRSADELSHYVATAKVRLMSNWQKTGSQAPSTPQCQTYDLSLTAAGWRINSFSWPVPKSCL